MNQLWTKAEEKLLLRTLNRTPKRILHLFPGKTARQLVLKRYTLRRKNENEQR